MMLFMESFINIVWNTRRKEGQSRAEKKNRKISQDFFLKKAGNYCFFV